MKTRFAAPAAAAITGVLGLTGIAQADLVGPFQLSGEGTSEQVGDQINITADIVMGDLDLDNASATVTLGDSTPFQQFGGDLTLTGDDGQLFATLEGAFFEQAGFTAGSGQMEITGGTGIFEDYFGSGVFTTMTDNATGATDLQLAGELIPAPGALALLGLAGLVGSRRRRAA